MDATEHKNNNESSAHIDMQTYNNITEEDLHSIDTQVQQYLESDVTTVDSKELTGNPLDELKQVLDECSKRWFLTTEEKTYAINMIQYIKKTAPQQIQKMNDLLDWYKKINYTFMKDITSIKNPDVDDFVLAQLALDGDADKPIKPKLIQPKAMTRNEEKKKIEEQHKLEITNIESSLADKNMDDKGKIELYRNIVSRKNAIIQELITTKKLDPDIIVNSLIQNIVWNRHKTPNMSDRIDFIKIIEFADKYATNTKKQWFKETLKQKLKPYYNQIMESVKNIQESETYDTKGKVDTVIIWEMIQIWFIDSTNLWDFITYLDKLHILNQLEDVNSFINGLLKLNSNTIDSTEKERMISTLEKKYQEIIHRPTKQQDFDNIDTKKIQKKMSEFWYWWSELFRKLIGTDKRLQTNKEIIDHNYKTTEIKYREVESIKELMFWYIQQPPEYCRDVIKQLIGKSISIYKQKITLDITNINIIAGIMKIMESEHITIDNIDQAITNYQDKMKQYITKWKEWINDKVNNNVFFIRDEWDTVLDMHWWDIKTYYKSLSLWEKKFHDYTQKNDKHTPEYIINQIKKTINKNPSQKTIIHIWLHGWTDGSGEYKNGTRTRENFEALYNLQKSDNVLIDMMSCNSGYKDNNVMDNKIQNIRTWSSFQEESIRSEEMYLESISPPIHSERLNADFDRDGIVNPNESSLYKTIYYNSSLTPIIFDHDGKTIQLVQQKLPISKQQDITLAA